MYLFSDAGAPCRFDSMSSSRGMCIFPCRCTKGCDQVTGQCLDDGQCNDGHPSGYNWRGTACQTGNVALDKDTSQSAAKWGDTYPARKAVDGAIDPLSYQHCAVPDAMPGSSTWWKVDFGGIYRISRVIIYNSETVVVETSPCPAIDIRARDRCGAAGISELDCQVRGCCWDGEARGSDISCYRKQCKAGYFGWRCRFQCHKCSTCDSITGQCPTTCRDDRWGVGCMLNNNCYYDNVKGTYYMGRQNSQGSMTCIDWTRHNKITDSRFADGSRATAKNYCRNPDADERPWCYKNNNSFYFICDVNKCDCDSRRFGVNCEKECHCKNVDENCQNNSPIGGCQSGCASHFTGPTCQDERRLNAFTLSVGNSSDIEDHSQCASHNGAVAAGETVNESCTATGRYLSFRRSGGGDNRLTTLCEVVVIGYRYVSCQHCPSTSTCNDIIGCDACAPGKQLPDCVRECVKAHSKLTTNGKARKCRHRPQLASMPRVIAEAAELIVTIARRHVAEALEDAQGYVIPYPIVSEKEDDYEDVSGCYNAASESCQQEGDNVYDVIQT
ncbi:hypothetical protein LSAT2_026309 [Lamellibrachia satsuma]|nr:hypothetical protein LSAT2_026309 [Lamellibrachia satsuma]